MNRGQKLALLWALFARSGFLGLSEFQQIMGGADCYTEGAGLEV